MELGSVTLKRIGIFCFPIQVKHSTHTVRYGTRLGDLKENWFLLSRDDVVYWYSIQ
jgi:hypothetical protein